MNLEADAESYNSDKSDQTCNFDDRHLCFGEELTESLHGALPFTKIGLGQLISDFALVMANG